MKTDILTPTDQNIRLAAAEIKNGGVVAFPTETVYGLGANALDTAAAQKIFLAKGRPSDNPLIVHLADKSDIESVGVLTPLARLAAEKFMPGALTMILKKRQSIPDIVTGGLDTVAVRIPDHAVALRFLAECGLPVAAPSANLSTRPSPTAAAHVFADLQGRVRYILDGGRCDIGLESTILDFSGEGVRLLRRGGLAKAELEAVLGRIDEYDGGGERPLSPGMKYRHYAPAARVKLFEFGDKSGIDSEYKRSTAEGIKTAVLCLDCGSHSIPDYVVFKSVDEYANGLFFYLRRADDNGAQLILCEKAPDVGLGESVNNRLSKAAAHE